MGLRRTILRAFAVSALLAASTHSPAGAELRWRKLLTSPQNAFRHDDLCFVSPLAGWVVNTDGLIYRTDDGGATWSTLLSQPQSAFRCVAFANETTGWTGTLGPGCFTASPDTVLLYATTNGGTSWTPVTNIPEPAPDGLCGLWAVSASVVYASGRVCGTPRLVKTTNGGATWTTIDLSPYADRLIDCYFPSADSGFVVGGKNNATSGLSHGVVLFTSDGGASWATRHTTSGEDAWCWKMSFPTRDVGYASVQVNGFIQPTYFLRTTDGGESWIEKPFPLAGFYEQGIGFATPEIGWVGGGPETYGTTDGGDTWQLDDDFGSGDDTINRFRFQSGTYGYAAGRKIFKYSDDAVVSVDLSEEIAAAPAIRSSAPNPFRSETRIEYAIKLPGRASLRLYDLLGREVLTLADAFHEAGTHARVLDGRAISSGVYVLRLDSAGYAESHKLHVVR